ncbi:hypothetical protein BBR47_36030 [Brevibacillus brevis NBRC 100599]|uniref:Uncharacterized protein n=1 Tax=Brevibacillus brevis (strain 47 / JCM 6285 / NBRC 100599) TaxID=358681 RepID=C0ZFM1_BREBN|nr:NADAR family protein [Brevibacillus brevis]BAH44580.1 hypothetical protein BBR47_36030 [Brevibacillus brevis NBRC 100599]
MKDHIRKRIQQPLEIHFDQPDKPYGCFSNFSTHPIELEGELWTTLEHYLQAKKFLGTTQEKEIMHKALQAKVEQYPVIREILLSTGDATLIDCTSNDSDMLGKLWMEVRAWKPRWVPTAFLLAAMDCVSRRASV